MMAKLTGKINAFSIWTGRFCNHCGKMTKRESGGYRCPSCGPLHWRKTRRVWFAWAFLDIFDANVKAFLLEKAVSQILMRTGVSWQMSMDRLKGLRGEAWLNAYMNIKKEVESETRNHLVGQIITLKGSWSKDIFVAEGIPSVVSLSLSKKKKKFVAGKLGKLSAVTDQFLSEYEKEVEFWEEIPILRFTKTLDEVEIEIGIRAPLVEYGKSYRVWMRVNGVHMYPTKPVRTGKSRYAWVLRAYHTEGWKDKLEKLLLHCVSLEDHTVKVVHAARKIDVKEAGGLLSPDLTLIEKEEIIDSWRGGSLWELAEEASRIDRASGLYVLKKFGLLEEL